VIATDCEPASKPNTQSLDTEDSSMNQSIVRRSATVVAAANKRLRRPLRASWLLFVMASAISVSVVHAQDNVVNPPLRVDIPTVLETANVVVDYGHAVFNGDMPFGLGDVSLPATDFREWKTQGRIVVVFHGDAAYMILNDETYNANRHVSSGNPYKLKRQGGSVAEPRNVRFSSLERLSFSAGAESVRHR
jgi:hypothetical protein